ncbi:hypothetical protein [uncultured Draconibacterium sp.]|uniref:hypothetical protein n=1 Tax=uncultured Draconibacterium sp. TaxID=1573823 RepID=UPI003261D0CA
MKSKSKLREFLTGIPESKRKLNPDLSNPNDYKRLIRISISLIKEDSTISTQDITTTCEDIGGYYAELIKHDDFESSFCTPIISEINNAKYIIEIYESLK